MRTPKSQPEVRFSSLGRGGQNRGVIFFLIIKNGGHGTIRPGPGPSWGNACTVDVSAAYNHVHMPPDAIPDLGFEWLGHCYPFFGAAVRPGMASRTSRLSWVTLSVSCATARGGFGPSPIWTV